MSESADMLPKKLPFPPKHSAQVHCFGPTPSQTVGPFFAYGLVAEQYGYAFTQPFTNQLVQPHAVGERIRIEGQVLDGDGVPITDALVEILHADGAGRVPKTREEAQSIGFSGFGRCGTGTLDNGIYAFNTVKPAAVDPTQAPHIHLCITMRGQLLHVFTRLYFADCSEANAADPLLQSISEPRRNTLIARSSQAGVWRFDVRMQGQAETAFFDL